MPTYQYSCTECGAALEAQQSFSDEPLTVCPECDGRLRKVFSAVGVVFKGSGFYRTDNRTAPSEASSSNGTSGSTKSDSEKSGSTKTESGSKKSGDSGSSSTSSPTKAGSAA